MNKTSKGAGSRASVRGGNGTSGGAGGDNDGTGSIHGVSEADIRAKQRELAKLVPNKFRGEPEKAYMAAVIKLMKDARNDRDVHFDDLAEKLRLEYDLAITGQSLRTKFNKGTMAFTYALMTLAALGVRTIKVPTLAEARNAERVVDGKRRKRY